MNKSGYRAARSVRAFFAWALVAFLTFWTLPSQAATATLTPTADAYVQNGANAAANFGTATDLRIQASATAASNYESHLKFDTTSVSGVISNAKLRIYAKLTATGTITASAYGVPITTWGETSITWNNKPAIGASLGSVVVNSTTYAYKDIDVTAYVQSEFNANRKVMSFAYRSGANTTPYITAYSKNSTSTNKPQLVITYATNAAPTVSVTSPTAGASFTAPANVNLTATAMDSDGSISKVEYYNGTTLIVTGATTDPYAATWSNVAAGTYSITAKATDNQGAVTTSSAVSITISAANTPPSSTLTSPTNGATYTAPASVNLTANATDIGGSISKVEYYNGTTLIATGGAAPSFAATWSNVAAGSYSLTAKATDNQGAATTSSPVSISVNPPNSPPTISLTAPGNGATYNAPANVTLTAEAIDSDGAISKVEYFNGATLIGTSTGPSPFAVNWSNVAIGTYSITAKATDNQSATTNSTAISINVNAPIQVIGHAYDELGRLVGTSDGSGSAAQYVYDPVGNITSIKRLGAGTTNIIDFTPDVGGAGVEVVISGTGFSTTPSLNTVRFNGISATVLTATTSRLVVNAPAGVTTGPVSVTSPIGSATSSTNFVVGGGVNAPTITGFSPLIGTAGTVVNISGTNFDTGAGRSKVRFNQTTLAFTSNVTSTSLTTTAPANVGSGKIRIITPNGYADSADNFTIPPSSIAVADIVDNKSIAVGGTQTLNITPINKVGLLLIEGGANPYRTLNVTSLITSPASVAVPYEIYSPQGVLITNGSISGNTPLIHLPALTQNATYAVYFKPGAATANITVALNANKNVVADGVSVPESITTVNQSVRLTFDGQSGQNLGLGLTGLSLSPAASTFAYIAVYRPDGSLLSNPSCTTTTIGGCGFGFSNLPQTGVYTMIVTPYLGGTGSFTATLSTDKVAAMTIATPYDLILNRSGQNARLSFNGVAGDNLRLAVNSVTLAPTNAGNATLYIYRPDGSQLYASNFTNGSSLAFDIPVLPTTGTYTLFVDMPNAATGGASFLLTSPLQAPLVIDAAPVPVSLLTGQLGQFSFTLPAPQNLGLGITGLSTSPTGGTVSVQIRQPDGSSVFCGAFTASGSCNVIGAVAGTYTVLVSPGTTAANLTLTFSSDLTAALTANGPAQTFATSRVGQNGAFTLQATAGQKLALSWPTSSIATGTLSVRTPNGDTIYNSALANASALEWTAIAGTYSILIDPTGASTGSVTLQLATDLTGTLAVNGASTVVSLFPGQNGRFTFSGTAGQNLGLGMHSFSTTPAGGSVNVDVLDPSGVSISGASVNGVGTSLNLSALPLSGTYTVVVDPVGTPATNLSLTLSQDVVGSLTANGPAVTFSTARIGQNGAYTFSGAAGQGMSLLLSNSTLGSSNLSVKGPNGVVNLAYLSQPGSFVLDLNVLPLTATYTAFIDTDGIQTGAITMALVADLPGTLAVNSASSTPVTLTSGQNARYTFTGAAGSRYAVLATGISTAPAGVGVYVSIIDPNGVYVTGCGALTVDTVCDVPSLGITGTYTVLVDPPETATASFSLGVKSEVTGTVTVDSSTATATTFTAGQNVRLSFNNGTVGATPKLTVSGLSLAPAGAQAYLRVLDPSGNNVFGNTYWIFSANGYTIDLPALSSVGTYTIEFDPRSFASGSASFAVRNSVAGAISIDGPAVTVNLLENQQPALNFATTVPNQGITLSFSAMSTTPVGGALRYSMSNATSWTSNITAPGVNLPQLPLASVGNYAMTLLPQSAFSGSVTVALVNDQTGTLTIGGAAVTHTPALVAQSKRITFTNTTANRATTIRINSSQWTSGTWWLIPPPGGGVITSTFPASTVARNVPVTLVQTGTYTLILVPAGTNVGTVSASVL